ncbi:skin secretory protein xP2-like [Contarinia nasturtii]|uniref:skin secretory protein xP2-like n=1 Tax=Contarinia nasturtii TaxID=265458 RepID=UPI0012D47951|nr:skin secretory protein xP2-like [Contarinia nasturtii]
MKVFICVLALVSYASAGLLGSTGYNYHASAHSAPVHVPALSYGPAPSHVQPAEVKIIKIVHQQPAAPSYSASQPQYSAPAPAPHYQPAPAPHYQPAPASHYQPAPAPHYQPAPAPQSQYLPPSAPVTHHQPAPPATTYGVPAAPAFVAPSLGAPSFPAPSAVKIVKIFEQPYQSSGAVSGGYSSGAVSGGFSSGPVSSGPASVFGSAHQASPDVVNVAVGGSPFTPSHAEGPHPAPAPTQIIKVGEAGAPEQIIKLVQEIPHSYGHGNLPTAAAPANIVKVPAPSYGSAPALAGPAPVPQLTYAPQAPQAPQASYGVPSSHSAPVYAPAPQQSYLAPSSSYSAPAPQSSYLPPAPQSSYLPSH